MTRRRLKSNEAVLYLLQGFALFVGTVKDNSLHRHPFIQLAFDPDAPFDVRSANGLRSEQFVLINSNSLHQIESGSQRHFILLVDPELDKAESLISLYFKEADIVNPSLSILEPVISEYNELLTKIGEGRAVTNTGRRTLDLLVSSDLPIVPKSEKIKEALCILKAPPLYRFGVRELSRQIGLSDSRLIHLFKEQVGMPIRRYVLWSRLRQAVRRIVSGASFTEAAHEAGFADSSHLSRTFRNMFGQKMLEIFKRYRSEIPLHIIIDED